MSNQQAIEEAAQGYQQQAELQRLAGLAKAKDSEYQTRQSKVELKKAMSALVAQDLQNDYLTQKAHELNPNMGREQGTMTEETQDPERVTEIDILSREVADLQELGGPMSQRKAAQSALENALDAEQREIAKTRTAAAQVQKVAQDEIKMESIDEREQALGEKQARKKAFYDKANPQKEWYE